MQYRPCYIYVYIYTYIYIFPRQYSFPDSNIKKWALSPSTSFMSFVKGSNSAFNSSILGDSMCSKGGYMWIPFPADAWNPLSV